MQLVISGTSILTTAYASALELSITGTQRITKTYYSAGSTLIAMRVVTSTGGNALYFMSGDHLGSTSLTTDIIGTVVARQLYDAWGNVRSGGGLPTDIGFTGQRLDATGLMFYHARYYSSASGRFISPDSLVPNPSDPQHFNRYTYVGNSPINHTDPTGHCFDAISFVFCVYEGLQLIADYAGAVLIGAGVGTGAAVLANALDDAGSALADGAAKAAEVIAAPIEWAVNDPLEYPLPAEYVPGAIQATYPLAGTTTILMTSVAGQAFEDTIRFQSQRDTTNRGRSQPPYTGPSICKGLWIAVCGGLGYGLLDRLYHGLTDEQPTNGPHIPTLPTSSPTPTKLPTVTPTWVPWLTTPVYSSGTAPTWTPTPTPTMTDPCASRPLCGGT